MPRGPASSEQVAAVTAVLAGDSRRFRDVVHLFDPAIRRVVRLAFRDPHTVEDVVQEVWCRAFRQLPTLRDARAAAGWLLQIARHCVVDQRRQTRRRVDVVDVDDTIAEREPADWVWELIDALPAAHGDVLRLRYREDCSYAEIGARLGVPTSTVRGRLYEARTALRLRLCERAPRPGGSPGATNSTLNPERNRP